jgi:hypothetical protein
LAVDKTANRFGGVKDLVFFSYLGELECEDKYRLKFVAGDD